jgi:hypothetical protein
MPTLWATVANSTFTIIVVLAAVAFYVFVAICLWSFVKAFEQISLSLAQIAFKAKNEADS